MGASQQSRPPDQPAPQATPLAKDGLSASGAALLIRLWKAQETAQTGDLSWTSDDPTVSLAADLIAAENGVASALRGNILLAAFPGIQPAVLTARRLQWALMGFSESDRFAGTAAALLVHSAADLPALEADSTVPLPLENAAPGQILLTPKTAELLRDLPGHSLRAASEAGPCELLWRGSEGASSRTSDEEALSHFIQMNGLENEAPAPPQPPVASPPETQPSGPDPVAQASAEAMEQDTVKFGLSGLHGFASGPRGKSRLPLVIAGVVATLLALLAVITISYKYKWEPKPASVAVPPAALPSAPSPVAAQPSQSLPDHPVAATSAATQPQQPKPSKQAPKDRKRAELARANRVAAEVAKTKANPPVAAAGNCELDSNLLPKMLDQAERSREQGNYAAALRQFRAVLACDRNNARARSGLDMTQFAMQHR